MIRAEGNKIALLNSSYCRNCLASPEQFHKIPNDIPPAEKRERSKMFEVALSHNDADQLCEIIRLLQHDWFKVPPQKHPFEGSDFDPYISPRCIEHDFSEGIVEYLIAKIFRPSLGANDSQRAQNCQFVADNVEWCPGLSSKCIVKLASVSHALHFLTVLFNKKSTH